MIWSHRYGQIDLTQRGALMGILNVTPDSFSDGGSYNTPEEALEHAFGMIEEGAEIIDVGGESTRPGSPEVPIEEELARVLPVVEKLADRWPGVISIDTSKPEVARRAVEAGARIVNDVTGLRDPEMIFVCRDYEVGVVVMHMQGTPRTMQLNPRYDEVVTELREFFAERYETLTTAGIAPEKLCFDPGIGFGKTLEHNKALLRGVDELRVENRPLMIGLSRKSFIESLLAEETRTTTQIRQDHHLRDWPTVALTSYLRRKGVRLHRVHAVRPNCDALQMAEVLLEEKDS